jgi:hypothetical protein
VFEGLVGIGDDEVHQDADEADADDGVDGGEETGESRGGGEVAESDGGFNPR